MREAGNFIESYLRYSEGHESTLRVRKWSAISIIAAALGRHIWMPRGDFYTLYPNLYVFIIGKSGLVKKSTSTGIAVNLLREVKGVHIMSEKLTASALIEQMALSGTEFFWSADKYTQSAVFAYASELQVFLEEVYGDLIPLLTTFYDCVPNDSSKPWVYRTRRHGETRIFGPCLNILGASTKAWLKKCIPSDQVEGGFASRVIFVVENNLPENLVAWPESTNELRMMKGKLALDLAHIHELKGEVTASGAAKGAFTKWYTHHMKNVMPFNQDPRIVGYMNRKGDTILKLAMIHSVSHGDSLELQLEDIEWAKKELEELEPDWKLAFDRIGSSDGQLAHMLLGTISGHGIINKRTLIEKFARQFPLTEVLRAVSDLKEMEEIKDGRDKETNEEVYFIPGYFERVQDETQ